MCTSAYDSESRQGKRLNPRKADLSRWRQTFAEKLRDGVWRLKRLRVSQEGQGRDSEPLWRIKAREGQRLHRGSARQSESAASFNSRAGERHGAWLTSALSVSEEPRD